MLGLPDAPKCKTEGREKASDVPLSILRAVVPDASFAESSTAGKITGSEDAFSWNEKRLPLFEALCDCGLNATHTGSQSRY
jgi:hypothetical protein